jgi:DNA-binding PadR family transcriptional regulator
MAVREGLLVLLAEQPRHGYELKTEFERRTGTLWRLNTGQVYTTLDRLQRDGLVEPASADEAPPSSDDRRRAYRLTDEGRAEAEAWLQARDRDDTPPRDELIMKVLLAAPGPLADALAVVDHHRHELLARLQEIRRRQRSTPAGNRRGSVAGTAAGDGNDDEVLALQLCDDVLIVRIEADLRWLDLCTDRLRARRRPNRKDRHTHTSAPNPPGETSRGKS